MPFSDTTNKNGILQMIEFWIGKNDGEITGDSTLLKMFTARVNSAFERLMPILLSFSDYLKWDDANQTDLPVGTYNLVSGQADYTIAQDDNSLDILNITAVRILASSTSTVYVDLQEMTSDDPDAIEAMSPNSSITGIPYKWLKRGNTIHLFPKPNYAATAGGKIFFERTQSYFVSSDTTKTPGIPRPFHDLLPLYASYDWLLVNKPDNGTLITRLEAQIARREKELRRAIEGRFPHRSVMKPKPISYL
jgi:hypothetical protein